MDSENNKPSAATHGEETLAALRIHVTGLLKPRFDVLLTEMTDHLFNISGSAQLSSEQRSSCFEAFSVLKGQSKHIGQSLVDRVDTGFSQLIKDASNEAAHRGLGRELDLIDLDEFEDKLAIDKIVKIASERYWLPWEAIVLRLANLLDCEPQTLALPFEIRTLCRIYRDGIRPLDFDRFIVSELDKAFARNLLPELGSFYEQIGGFLADRGLLPEIESELEQTGSRLTAGTSEPGSHRERTAARPAVENDNKTTTPLKSEAGWLSEPQGGAASSLASAQPGTTAETQDAMRAALTSPPATHPTSTERSVDAPLAQASAPAPTDTAALFATASVTHDGPSFLESDAPLVPLSPLDDAASTAGQSDYLPGRGSQQLGNTLDTAVLERLTSGAGYGGQPQLLPREELDKRAAELAGDIATLRQQGIVADSSETSLVSQLRLDELGPEAEPLRASVQLVEDIYATFQKALNIDEGMSKNIDLIKLPLAELSLTNPGFLNDREHPARLLVERLSELTSLSPDNNARMEQRVQKILSEVSSGYQGDVAIFDQALGQVTDLALGLLKQQQRNIQRQVAAEEGREKRSAAVEVVDALLKHALPDAQLPASILALIDGVLRDHWVLSAVRGADTPALQAMIQPAASVTGALLQVAESTGEFDDTETLALVQQLRNSVDDTGFMPPEQVALFDAIDAELSGRQKITLVESNLGITNTLAEPGLGARLQQLPRLRRWVRRAKELNNSDWLVERLGDDTQRNLQLIWSDADKTQFAFANEQGQKVREVNVIQLAHWLSTRLTPLNPSERLSIIERSVFSTLARKQSALATTEQSDTADALNRSALIDTTQSMLRRARRRGASHSAIAIHIEGSQPPEAIKTALGSAGLQVVASGLLSSSTQGVIVDSADSTQLQQALRDNFDITGEVGLGVAAIDPAYQSADELWRSVEETAKRGLALSPNTGILATNEARPTDLAGAVQTTYERLKTDMPPRLSLRRVLRTRTSDVSQMEEVFQVLLDGMPDAGGEMARSAGYHSSALSIALDYIKVNSACRIAEDLGRVGRAVPVFSLRLSTDAALHDDFLEFVLNEVSESGIGTDRLCLEFRDSARLREESRVADFARTLRSIGCLIAVCDVNPARGATTDLQVMSPHMLALDNSLWPPSEGGDHLPALHQAISDLHHLVGEHVVLRDNRERERAAEAGIDFVEFFDPDQIDPPSLAERLPMLQR